MYRWLGLRHLDLWQQCRDRVGLGVLQAPPVGHGAGHLHARPLPGLLHLWRHVRPLRAKAHFLPGHDPARHLRPGLLLRARLLVLCLLAHGRGDDDVRPLPRVLRPLHGNGRSFVSCPHRDTLSIFPPHWLFCPHWPGLFS